MGVFSNKHVVTALIVAPILAVLAYYLVDLTVKEQPQPALAGAAYKLIAQSNCRFTSGACDLVNGTFKSTLSVSETNDGQELVLTANNNLQTASVGFVEPDGQELGPFALFNTSGDNKRWTIQRKRIGDPNTVIRIAISANNSHYFAETTMAFTKYETSFNKDLRN